MSFVIIAHRQVSTAQGQIICEQKVAIYAKRKAICTYNASSAADPVMVICAILQTNRQMPL